jgi:hypothetical protein
MRFLVMVEIPGAREAEWLPTADERFREEFAKMGAFNDTLSRDGVLLGAEGLQPSSKGVRISYAGGKPTATDGPFTESKELVAGFWLVQARSKEELVERFKHCPFKRGERVEIRPLYEAEDLEGIV